MSALTPMLQKFAADERGATAIEYGLIVGLIFLAILASVETVAGLTSVMFTLVAAMMS
ncbi:MAG: Flp family type IVb pilin [Micropepsaceae bacterium]